MACGTTTRRKTRNTSKVSSKTSLSSKVPLSKLCDIDLEQISPTNRLNLMVALRHALKHQNTLLTAKQSQQLNTLVRHICDWPLLIQLNSSEYLNPTTCEIVSPYIQLGKFEKGLTIIQNSLNKCLEDKKLQELQAYLNNKLCEQPHTEFSNISDKLYITPLDYHHVGDFIWQFADPAIAQLCTLPKFESAEHWINWLYECKQDKHRHLYAVLHKEMGFIGSVCIQIHDGLGFFYYWLGKDFQGQGFGPQAVKLLLDVGYQRLGMTCCFTKIFDHNMPSLSAIAKLDFTTLPFSAKPPSDNEIFYYQGKETNKQTLYEQLDWFLEKLNSGITLSPLSTNLP